jgi:Mrp family chromosome partitioning ATPase
MSATDYAALEAFVPRPAHRYETFTGNGMGPFVVIRDALVTAILNLATPHISVHISGCRGAGKTTVLLQLAEKLREANKTVDISSRVQAR